MQRIPTFGFALALLALAAGAAEADEQPKSAEAMASKADSTWSPVDYDFVAQANLGAPFQIASGRIAEEKATTGNIRDYARLMVVTHIPVVDALALILRRERVTAPPNTLLQGAYDAMIASLKADRAPAFDRDYVEGQVDCQKGNAALFRNEIKNGTDADLKEFTQRTLPKIEDHLQRALKLAKSAEIARASSR
jgi:putative membrane protein